MIGSCPMIFTGTGIRDEVFDGWDRGGLNSCLADHFFTVGSIEGRDAAACTV